MESKKSIVCVRMDTAQNGRGQSLSILIPFLNEEDNLGKLYDRLCQTCQTLKRDVEFIFIDDGSTDSSLEKVKKIAEENPAVKVIIFRKNFGQSAAIKAGIQHASGEIILTIDADLQNDPADILLLLTKIDEGYDLVQGWRRKREDLLFSRRIPSIIANRIIALTTGLHFHDFGCALRAIRRDVAREIEMNGDAHRFLPLLAYWKGARCCEIVVQHHPRTAGKSKYGIERTFKVILDLIALKFIEKYTQNPMRLFGGYGLAFFTLGVASGTVAVAMKIVRDTDITGNPLTFLFVLFIVVGVQFLFMGMLGELCSRIFSQASQTHTYSIRATVNI